MMTAMLFSSNPKQNHILATLPEKDYVRLLTHLPAFRWPVGIFSSWLHDFD